MTSSAPMESADQTAWAGGRASTTMSFLYAQDVLIQVLVGFQVSQGHFPSLSVETKLNIKNLLKESVSKDFWPLVFFIKQLLLVLLQVP